jgi:hypothetical protein
MFHVDAAEGVVIAVVADVSGLSPCHRLSFRRHITALVGPEVKSRRAAPIATRVDRVFDEGVGWRHKRATRPLTFFILHFTSSIAIALGW